ncbi:MAG: adenylate/guanylate cyclase domain-containing protein, partial [Candidatus Riflebacteria bacterium]|nr:adenylate/guanylate cyclase domain-containing protein [Candidatus Riflebacteria bacterium]
ILQQAVNNPVDNNLQRMAWTERPEFSGDADGSLYDQTAFAGKPLFLGVKLVGKGESSFSQILAWLRILAGAILLLGFLSFMHALLFGMQIRFELRVKMALAIAVVVFIPALLVGVLTRASLHDFMSSRSDMAQGYLMSRLDELELAQDELDSRQVLQGLRFKSHIEKYWGDGLHKTPEAKIIPDYLSFFSGRNFFYDRSGNSLHFRSDKIAGHTDRLTLNNAVRLLSSLSGLQPGERTRKQLENLSFTDAFLGDLNALTNMSLAASRESEIVGNLSSLNPLSRDIVALYADSGQRPIRPHTIGFVKANPEGAMARLIKTSPGFPTGFFMETSGDYNTRIAFANRDNEFVTQEFLYDPSFRRDMDLKLLFDRAMELKSSGSSVAEDSPEKVAGWRYRNDYPHIFAGTTTFSPDSFTALFLDLVPLAVFVYSLIIMLVVSRFVAGLFMTPIETVSLGVRAVAAGEDLTMRVQICNNDEFDRMGNAFNEMTAGLLQKRHISRFVSDRLLAEIASPQSKAQAREEVATVLASDLRNFTGISEKFPPEMVVDVLNDYFTLMEQAIKAENGSIDKFIGDAIIAVFYAQEDGNTALRAARAACAMRRSLSDFNETQLASGRFAIDNGIGLATGRLMSAVAGSRGRREFIVTGAPVERAEALEPLSKQGRSSRIIVDGETCVELQGAFSCRPLNGHQDVYEIAGPLA